MAEMPSGYKSMREVVSLPRYSNEGRVKITGFNSAQTYKAPKVKRFAQTPLANMRPRHLQPISFN